mgnify:FL=1
MTDKVRDLRVKEKFVVDDLYLNGYAKRCGIFATGVYNVICRHADREQTAFPGIDLIAKKLNISRPSVIKGITNLQDYNIIKVIKKKDKKGRQKVNLYILLDKSVWKPLRVKEIDSENCCPSKPENKTESMSEQNRVNEIDCKVTQYKETHVREREGKKPPSCPYQSIVDIYHEVLPELPMVKELTETRKRQLKARWFSKPERQSLDYWQKYFKYVRESLFLMGQANTNGHKFQANFEWLTKESNFIKTLEGQYHND